MAVLHFTLIYLDSTLLYYSVQYFIVDLLDSTFLYHASTSLYLTLHYSAVTLLYSTWPYISQPVLYFTLLDSTLLYSGNTLLYLTLHYSTMARLHGWYFMYRSLEYVIFTSCNVLRRIYSRIYNTVLRIKDGVVHHSRQQSLVAKWLGLCVHS